MTRRVAAEDARLLHLAAAGHQMATFTMVTLDGPSPSNEEITERVDELVGRLGRYRCVPAAVPFNLQRPVWVAAERFDVADHLVFSTLDGESDEGDVARLMARLSTRPLPGHRPPWEIWVVRGLRRHRWLLAARIHLALVDGLGASDLFSALLAEDPAEIAVEPAEQRPPAPALVLDAVRDMLTSPYEQVRAVNSLLGRLQRPPRPSTTAPPDLFHRRFTVRLEALDAVRDSLGGTVNDVLATILAGGVRRVEPTRTVATFALPYAVRSLSRPGHYDNQIAVDVVELPIAIESPAERYRTIAARLDRFSRQNLAVGGKDLARLSGFGPPLLLALGARAVMGVHADMALVNAPGPRRRITTMGRTVVDAHATIPHPAAVRWSATALSYAGRVSIGVTSTSAGEPAAIVDGMRQELTEVAELARSAQRAATGAPP